MKKIYFIMLIAFFAGCQKESIKTDDTSNNTDNPRNVYIGQYCGEVSSPHSWTRYEGSITKSDIDSNRIIFKYFPAGMGSHDIEAIVDKYNFIIPEQTFHGWQHYNYEEVISGNGTLDTGKFLLQGNYTAKITWEDGYEGGGQGSFRLFISSKYSYLGTYKGDGNYGPDVTVNISSSNNKLTASIVFQNGSETYGWENISVSEDRCDIIISARGITEISSGEKCNLSGACFKLGNQLKINIQETNPEETSLRFYNFLVTKIE